MDARAAKAIASCIRQIARAEARLVLIEQGLIKYNADNLRVNCSRDIETMTGAIAQWFQQPMTFR